MLSPQVQTLKIRVELIAPGTPVFHVERYGAWRDLWLACDAHGRLRTLCPTRGLNVHTLALWHGDWPPLTEILGGAVQEMLAP